MASLYADWVFHSDVAIKKMLATLDDPFTRFLEPEKFKSLRVLGCYLKKNLVVVVSTVKYGIFNLVNFGRNVVPKYAKSSLKAVWNSRYSNRCWVVNWLPNKIK